MINKKVINYYFIFIVLFTVFLITNFIINFERGFTFTDEAYYLQIIKSPFKYNRTASLFGFIYHPLYSIFNGNIYYLRICNFFIIYILSLILTYKYIYLLGFTRKNLDYMLHIAISIAIANITVLVYIQWFPTPNYNMLTYKGLLIIVIAILYIINNKNINNDKDIKKNYLGWFFRANQFLKPNLK
jgi:hypothetical protein